MVHDKRNQAISDMRAILDLAADEKRDLNPEEIEKVERADADADKYGKESDRAIRADELAAQAAEYRGITSRVESAPVAEQEAPVTEMDLIHRGFAAVRSGSGYAYDAEQIASIRPSEAYFRALQSAGGTAIPTTFTESVIEYQRTATPMLDPGIVTVLETPTGNPIDLPRLTADPAHEEMLDDLRGRLARWMERTDDPLLRGPVASPEA